MRKQSLSDSAAQPTPRTGGSSRRRDWLRQNIMLAIRCCFNLLELAIYIALIAIVFGLIVLCFVVAASTSFLWLPVCLICLPLLCTIGILLRYTRLWEFCLALITKL